MIMLQTQPPVCVNYVVCDVTFLDLNQSLNNHRFLFPKEFSSDIFYAKQKYQITVILLS